MEIKIKGKKGSMFLIVFFIAIILSVFFMVGLQQNRYTEDETQQLIEQTQRGYLGSYTEQLKKFTFHSLRDACTTGSFVSAENYGGADLGYWTAYGGPVPPSLNQSKGSIESVCGDVSNDYLLNLQGQDFGKIIFNDTGSITTVEILVQEADLEETIQTPDGLYSIADEGFLTTGGGLSTVVSSGINSEVRMEEHLYTDQIFPVRYWYLYRHLRDWAQANILGGTTCQTMQIVKGYGNGACCIPAIDDSIVQPIVDAALNDLQARFDQHVECEVKVMCKFAKTTPIVSEPQECTGCPDGCSCACMPGPGQCVYDWQSANEDCESGECDDPHCNDPAVPCNDVTIPYAPFEWTGQPNCQNIQVPECSSFGEEHEVSFIAEFKCTDYKFQSPVGKKKFENIVYKALTHVYLTHRTEPPGVPCDTSSCPIGGGPAPVPVPEPVVPEPGPPGEPEPAPAEPEPEPGPGPGPGPVGPIGPVGPQPQPTPTTPQPTPPSNPPSSPPGTD